MNEILNQDDFQIILQNYSNQKEVKYISSKCLPFSDQIEGFLGAYFILEITFENKNEISVEKFFVKTIPLTNFQNNIARERNVYNKEIFFYTYLLNDYERFGLDTSFAPKCYHSKNSEILVMENLLVKQFILSEKNEYYDLDLFKAGLKSLAKFHAGSMIYEEEKTKELGKKFRLNEEYPEMFKENYYDTSKPDNFGSSVLHDNVKGIKFMLNHLKDTKYNKKFESLITEDNLLSCFKTQSHFRQAVGHGDLWSNNIFFNYKDSKVNKCIIVDYQVLRYFYPAYDVLLFIYLNADPKYRHTNLPYLLQFYYDSLGDIFSKHRYDINKILPLEEYHESLKFVKTSVAFNVICIGTLVFLPEDVKAELFCVMDDNAFETLYKMFCLAFNTNETYRFFLKTTLDDLHDSLFENYTKYT